MNKVVEEHGKIQDGIEACAKGHTEVLSPNDIEGRGGACTEETDCSEINCS